MIVQYQKTTGTLCSCDYKGVGNQYVTEDKLIIETENSVFNEDTMRMFRGG